MYISYYISFYKKHGKPWYIISQYSVCKDKTGRGVGFHFSIFSQEVISLRIYFSWSQTIISKKQQFLGNTDIFWGVLDSWLVIMLLWMKSSVWGRMALGWGTDWSSLWLEVLIPPFLSLILCVTAHSLDYFSGEDTAQARGAEMSCWVQDEVMVTVMNCCVEEC